MFHLLASRLAYPFQNVGAFIESAHGELVSYNTEVVGIIANSSIPLNARDDGSRGFPRHCTYLAVMWLGAGSLVYCFDKDAFDWGSGMASL